MSVTHAQEIRARLAGLGVSQHALAQALGTSQATLSLWLNGYRQPPAAFETEATEATTRCARYRWARSTFTDTSTKVPSRPGDTSTSRSSRPTTARSDSSGCWTRRDSDSSPDSRFKAARGAKRHIGLHERRPRNHWPVAVNGMGRYRTPDGNAEMGRMSSRGWRRWFDREGSAQAFLQIAAGIAGRVVSGDGLRRALGGQLRPPSLGTSTRPRHLHRRHRLQVSRCSVKITSF